MNSAIQHQPGIFEYTDYRMYLKDYYAFRKKSERRFSYRKFAADSGVAASLLKDILSGRQNLSVKIMTRYASAMKLNEKQTAYFEAMVQFNNSKTNDQKNEHFNRLVELRGRCAVKFLDVKQYSYFSKWYNAVVRELIVDRRFKGNPESIAKLIKPKVTVSQVKKSIDLLAQLGLIRKNSDGAWVATSTVISSEYEIQSVGLKNFHRTVSEIAMQALDSVPSDRREFQGLTLSCSRQTFNRIKQRIRSFTDELLDEVSQDNAENDLVFQLNLQIFPFAELDIDK